MMHEKSPTRREIEKGEREEEKLAKEYLIYLSHWGNYLFGLNQGWTQEKMWGRAPDIDRVIKHNGRIHHYLEIKTRTIPMNRYTHTILPYRKVEAAKRLRKPVYAMIMFSDGLTVLFPMCRKYGSGPLERKDRHAKRTHVFYPISEDDLITRKPTEKMKWTGWEND